VNEDAHLEADYEDRYGTEVDYEEYGEDDREEYEGDRDDIAAGEVWPPDGVAERLEYLRGEIKGERISYGEIAELQGLAQYIDPSDVELLEWAGVPEHGTDPE
jgi:hypothetical protein